MKTSLADLHSRIPGAPSARWPDGERFAIGFEHGTMTLGLYAPSGADPQRPHERDEIYIVHSGSGEIEVDGEVRPFAPGDAFFVAAGAEHRFRNFSPDFAAWVVFWGPSGGEADA